MLPFVTHNNNPIVYLVLFSDKPEQAWFQKNQAFLLVTHEQIHATRHSIFISIHNTHQ